MSRMSDSRSNSKSMYQGMVLKRAQRSEYDDSQLRDLARHDARLDHEIKTVERARTVMRKSMEADRQLFIKAGAQNNTKVTKSRQGTANTRHVPTSQAAAQHSRLVSDTRVKRSSVSDSDNLDTAGLTTQGSSARSTNQGQTRVTTSSSTQNQRQKRDSNNNHNNNDTNHNTKTTTNSDSNNNNNVNSSSNNDLPAKASPEVAPPGDSLYDSFFLENVGNTSALTGSRSQPHPVPLATPIRLLDTRPGDNNNNNSNSNAGTSARRSPRTPDRKGSGPIGIDQVDRPSQASDVRRTGGGQSKAKPGLTQDRSGQASKVDSQSGRFLKTKWDSLATPKHSSPQLTKRAQIQQEFSRPNTRNSSTSPAAQARLLGTFTVNVGESTPVPTSAAAATTTAAAIPPASTSSAVGNGGATTVHRKKSAQNARRQ